MTKKLDQEIEDLTQQNGEILQDLQRTRADFENYRKRVDGDISRAKIQGEQKTIARILPILDILDTAIAQIPDDLRANSWVQGIAVTGKNLAKICAELKLEKLNVKPGDDFNHEIMNAVAVDENSDGAREIVAEILQNGWTLDGAVLRPAMVKVARQPADVL
jgi:molecular chaperone GrpE